MQKFNDESRDASNHWIRIDQVQIQVTYTSSSSPPLVLNNPNPLCTACPIPSSIKTWGSHGTDNGQFNLPLGIAVDSSGNVYVADTGNYRIQKFAGQVDTTHLTKPKVALGL